MNPITCEHLQHITEQLYQQQAPELQARMDEGIRTTTAPNVRVFYYTHNLHNESALYEPSVVLLFSGRKQGRLGPHVFNYDAAHGLLLTASYPIEYDSEASAAQPLVGVQIILKHADVAQLLREVVAFAPHAPRSEPKKANALGIESIVVDDALRVQVWHLLQTLLDPVATALFGQARLNAVTYALLTGAGARLLYDWGTQEGALAQFHRAVDYIEQHYNQDLRLDALAKHVGMSVSSLHRAFKRHTADSPLQYAKKIRLNWAHTLLAQGNNVQTAALQVGYESASQFSREYTRYFKRNPKVSKRTV